MDSDARSHLWCLRPLKWRWREAVCCSHFHLRVANLAQIIRGFREYFLRSSFCWEVLLLVLRWTERRCRHTFRYSCSGKTESVLQVQCSAELPPHPLQAFLPYMATSSWRLQACGTLSVAAMQSDLFLSPVIYCSSLSSLALPKREWLYHSLSFIWSHRMQRTITKKLVKKEKKIEGIIGFCFF